MQLKALNPRIPWRIWRNGPGSVKKPNHHQITSLEYGHSEELMFFSFKEGTSHGKILKPRVSPHVEGYLEGL